MKTNAKFKKNGWKYIQTKGRSFTSNIGLNQIHESMMMRARALMQAELRGGRQSNYLIFSTLET